MAIRAPYLPLTGLYSASSDSSLTTSSLQASSYRLVDIRKPLQSSFFNGGVGSLKLGLRVAHSDRCRFRRDFVVRANLFARFTRVIKSYINAVLSSFEDPEKILEQSVLEMNADLIKMRQGTAQVMASQKGLENQYKAAQQTSEDWYRKAQLALKKGDEELAREALERRKSHADKATSLKNQLDQQKRFVENLLSNTRLLESKIQEAKLKKDNLKARAQSAKTATQVSEMLGTVNMSSALSAFEKMEEKVMAMEFQAEALIQLTTDDLEGKFAYLEGSSIDNDLTSLKNELSGSSQKIDLSVVGNTKYFFQDSDIENEIVPSFRQLEKDFIHFKTPLRDTEGTNFGIE